MSGERLRLGFIALNDAASMIVADARGWFAEELSVDLVRGSPGRPCAQADGGRTGGATCWPRWRWHLAGPATAGRSPGAMALNLNGPAITLSSRLEAAVGEGPGAAGLARLVARRQAEGASPLTLAVVFPYSAHAYLLRDWLARAGVDPDRDVRLTVAPPSRMTELLVGGVVEGFCVTEPWDTAAVAAGAGFIAARGGQLWPRMPDKVFALARRARTPIRAACGACCRPCCAAPGPTRRRTAPELAGSWPSRAYVSAGRRRDRHL